MADITHPELVAQLVKTGDAIVADITPSEADLWHAVSGISGEAGELLDAVKKHVIYKREIDRDNVIEELGDLEFYMEQLRQRLSITREEVLAGNIAKLTKRYHQMSYSNEQALARADKGGE